MNPSVNPEQPLGAAEPVVVPPPQPQPVVVQPTPVLPQTNPVIQPPQPVQPPPIPTPQPAQSPAMPPQFVTGGDVHNLVTPLPKKRGLPKPLKIAGIVVAVIVLLVGGFFGYKFLAAANNKKAAQNTADTFAHGLYEGDYDAVSSVYDGDGFSKENVETSEGEENPFVSLEHIDMVIGTHEGKERGVALFKFVFKEEYTQNLGLKDNAYYMLVMLQKTNGKWRVPNMQLSFTEPKLSLEAYTESGIQILSPDEDDPGSSKRSEDVERETDIRALHGQMEAYYAQHGHYPSLANVNDKTWRNTNMRGLDDGALEDPEGSSSILVSKPIKNTYAYAVSTADHSACDNAAKKCMSYTLAATKSDGSLYIKKNLN